MQPFVDLVRTHVGSLSPAERRVADAVLADRRLLAFGTAAEVAARAGVGVGTVARFAARLGLSGFAELQRHVRHELAADLRPAVERIRDRPAASATASFVSEHAELEAANVAGTLAAADPARLDRVAGWLADTAAPVAVLSGDASSGIARQLVDELGALRTEVVALTGNQVSVTRTAATSLRVPSTIVVVDLRRYDRWVVDATNWLAGAGHRIVAISDGALSPPASVAGETFVVTAASLGPFESHVGTLALVHLLVALAAVRLGDSATERLDRAEAAWQDVAALLDR